MGGEWEVKGRKLELAWVRWVRGGSKLVEVHVR